MAPKELIVLALAVFATVSHASEAQKFEKARENRNRAGKSVFNYDGLGEKGPEKWGDLSPDFSMCKKGHHQSPINLDISKSTSDGQIPEVRLNESVVEYSPSGNNFALNCIGGTEERHCSTITFYEEKFHMLQAHFHSPSEHHINGKEYPLEMHLVHKSENGNSLLVLGVLFELGKFNGDVEKLMNAAKMQNKQIVDFPHFVQPGAGLCTYEGSLTTPPCTEGVHWLISNTVVPVSLKQVGEYREMVGENINNRPVQPVADPQTRCYLNPKFTGGVAKQPSSIPKSSSSGTRSVNDRTTWKGSNSGSRASTSTESATTANDPSPNSTLTSSETNSTSDSSDVISLIPEANNTELSESTGIPLASPVPQNSNSTLKACFTADSKVQLSNGDLVRMDELQIGDEVSVGYGKFSKVFLFTHRDKSAVTTHVRLTTASGKSLTLSPGHYLRANGYLVAANLIRVGDTLIGEHGHPETVNMIGHIQGTGLFNPHTVSGEIAVEGIVCSTYTTAVARSAAHALLAPIRAIFRLGGVTEEIGGRFSVNRGSNWIV